jgi:hypothetical protein
MSVAIAVELFGTKTPPPVLVTVTGLLPGDVVNVTRECSGEPTEPVRGAVDRTGISGDALVTIDPQPQLGRLLVYVANVEHDDGTSEQVSTSITVPDPGRHVLSDPFGAAAVLVDVVATPDERKQALRASVLRPAGRRRPVVIADVRQDDEGELTVYTRDRVETAQLVALLAAGTPVVSRRTTAATADLPGTETLIVTDATRARRSLAGDRVWQLPFAVVDLPDPALAVSLVSLGDIADYYGPTGTLAELATDYPGTLLDVARSDFGTA